MTDYNVNVGVPTTIESLIKIKTYSFHPYGLENFRKEVLEHISDWQNKGLSWRGYDNLTHAWRTPWDTHLRYPELLNILQDVAISIINQIAEPHKWFISDLWISEYSNGSAANKHNHGNGKDGGWSFCYYVEVPDNGPGFTLCDDVSNELNTINVKTGDLLIFENELNHQVMPSIERRVIISGNLTRVNDALILKELYNDVDFFKKNSIYSNISNNEVNVDDWSISTIEQKTGLKDGGGY